LEQKLIFPYSFLNLNGATKIKIGSLEEPKDPDKPVQVEELHYWLTSKITEKLTDNKVCVSTTTPNNPSCIEKYIEEKIQCKIPWTFPDTGNYQRRFAHQKVKEGCWPMASKTVLGSSTRCVGGIG